ncbi:hypothetical protein Taro_004954, partial [Colocasia esculenta]|nr:hypothetical protein [Colocasia esculenta]
MESLSKSRERYNQLIDHVGIHGQRSLTEALNNDSLVWQKEYPMESSPKSRESVYIETSARHSRGILEQWSIDNGLELEERERESLRESSPHEISSSLASSPGPATLDNELGPQGLKLGECTLPPGEECSHSTGNHHVRYENILLESKFRNTHGGGFRRPLNGRFRNGKNIPDGGPQRRCQHVTGDLHRRCLSSDKIRTLHDMHWTQPMQRGMLNSAKELGIFPSGYNQLVDHVGIHGQRSLTGALNKDSLVRQKEYLTESSPKSRESVYIETSARRSRGILEQWSVDNSVPNHSENRRQ